MTSTALAARGGGDLERPTSGPGRELGQKRKPQLRLALGYRDEQRRGAPVKTDYFVPKGDDRAVQKFMSVYGDKPRAVDIRLPASLGGFLDIRHVAFAGGQNDGGGVLKAIGSVNFALEGTLGGPDKLTVFNIVETGEVDRNNNPVKQLQTDEVYIDDVDDPAARDLGVYLQASVSFGIPDVLGFGGICEIRSRGKETIDTLWLTAVDIYGALGARASLILRPKLVLKESTMITPRGSKAQVYVVDLYVPESMDEIVGRLREMRELTGPSSTTTLYGSRELTSGGIPEGGVALSSDAVHATPPGAAAAEVAAPREDVPEPGPAGTDGFSDEPGPAHPLPAADPELQAAADAAAAYKPGTQKWPGMTLGEIFNHGDDGREYVKWCLSNARKPEFLQALHDLTRVYWPEAYHEAVAAREVQQ